MPVTLPTQRAKPITDRAAERFATGRIVDVLLAKLEEQRAVTGAVQPG